MPTPPFSFNPHPSLSLPARIPAPPPTPPSSITDFAELREEDLDETFMRSGGPGGQSVNKLATGVWLKHKPTGVRVKCTAWRSQEQNRAEARKILLGKISCMRDQYFKRQKHEEAKERRRARQTSPESLERKKTWKIRRSEVKKQRLKFKFEEPGL